MQEVVIGTRGSALALWQANHVRDRLLAGRDGLEVRLEIIHTQGDKLLQDPLHKLGDKGLFTKEIEQALIEGRVDLAVHSLKDLPTATVAGLEIAAISAREDPADALISRCGCTLDELPKGALVLTSSLRRQAQLLHRRPDMRVGNIRGNVPTRLRKFDQGEADAVLFASAGLVRLGLAERITQRLDPTDFLPACGQGALAVEIRQGDPPVATLVEELNDSQSRWVCMAERAFLGRLQGGCQVPVGAYGRFAGGEMTLSGFVAGLDGSRLLRREIVSEVTSDPQAAEAGRRLAGLLLEDGCGEILEEVLRQSGQGDSDQEAGA